MGLPFAHYTDDFLILARTHSKAQSSLVVADFFKSTTNGFVFKDYTGCKTRWCAMGGGGCFAYFYIVKVFSCIPACESR